MQPRSRVLARQIGIQKDSGDEVGLLQWTLRPPPHVFGYFWKRSSFFHSRPSPLKFFRLVSNAFPDIRSIGRIEKKKLKKRKITRFGRRPGTPASLLWNLETTRHEPKINMAETLVDVIVELRQRGKKDQPTKLLCDTQASLTFHQLKLYWFFRLKELFQVKNGLTTSSLFFLKCQKFGSVGWR